MANNLMMGLPRKGKVAFDPKLDPAEAEAFPVDEKSISKSWKILRYIGVGISFFATFVTLINSYEWWAALRPVWVAWPMALTLVGASIFLPDFGILLAREKHRIIGSAVFFAGVLATLFCMVTTVAALYNTHTWKVEDVSLANRTSVVAKQSLADRVMDRDRLLRDIQVQADLMRATQDKLDRLDAQDALLPLSQTLQNRLLSYQRTKQGYESTLATLDRDIVVLRQSASQASVRYDFYGFLATVFGGDPTTVEFLTQAIPAVFLEIVAPVMVAVVIFL